MRGLTPLEAWVLTVASGQGPPGPIVADFAQRAAAETLVAAGRARLELALKYGPNARRLLPTPEGRLALMIHRSLFQT